MKPGKIFSLIVLLYLFSFTSYAQIKLKLEVQSESKEAIKFKITSINTSSSDTLLFYIPSENSFCASLINIDFKQVETDKEHDYFPCTEILDLDHVRLSKTNSILILPNSSYSFEISLKKKNIHPFLSKRSYRVKATLNYEYGNFKSALDATYPIYSGSVTSNEQLILNK